MDLPLYQDKSVVFPVAISVFGLVLLLLLLVLARQQLVRRRRS